MKISAALIVKNESSCLDKCLSSIQGIDEIVVCDTGSTDNTIEIAKKYTDKVFDDYKWNDNFAEARNHALTKVTGEWVLVIDADETLMTPIEEIRQIAEEAEKAGFKTASFRTIHEKSRQEHRSARLHKNCPEVFWKAAAHNYLSVAEKNYVEATIEYGYSDAHKLDPDRTLRILTKVVTETPECVREKYYLAREYWYRKDFATALHWYEEYLKVATWLPERADGVLMAAKCLWHLQRGEEARQKLLQAIGLNPDFKEALTLMASMHYEPHRSKWQKLADQATNKDVLFIRIT